MPAECLLALLSTSSGGLGVTPVSDTVTRLPKADRQRVAAQLGEFLAALHEEGSWHATPELLLVMESAPIDQLVHGIFAQ